MKQRGISNQIIIIAIMPALLLAAILFSYFMYDQLNYISSSLERHGKFIVRQLAPAAEYAVYSGNTEFISPLIDTTLKNHDVIRIQITDKTGNSILDVQKPETDDIQPSYLAELLESHRHIVFTEPVLSTQLPVADFKLQETTGTEKARSEPIGTVTVTLSTRFVTQEKIAHVVTGAIITLVFLLLISLAVIRISHRITRPIQSLSHTVRNIASGNLDTRIKEDASGEIGILQSCINHMTEELQHFQSDMEEQLNEYTNELQETLEELEIRNAELDIARSRAISANRAKSEFLANMSHEIRTPLSGIIGFTELLHETQQTDQQLDYTNTIRKSANNLLEIINDILDLSKIESGKTEINSSEFNLIDIIEDIVNLLTPTAYEKNIELFYRVDSRLPKTILADPFRIHQIITNLVGNAIKFTETGYVYLQADPGELETAGFSIKFTVADTGIGMNQSDKKKLFKAFTQADTTITRRFGGTGLGLVISKKLTILMNGEIGFDSTLGEGSTFWFCIPASIVDNDVKYEPRSALGNKKIGFVANHVIARQAFKSTFEGWQCRYTELSLDELCNADSSTASFDATVVFIGRKDFTDPAFMEKLSRCHIPHPNLLIASTRTEQRLKKLQGDIFDEAIFTSERTEVIRQKLEGQINHLHYVSDAIQNHSHAGKGKDWSALNIMVVDDNDISLRLAEIILHKNRANVTTARSGEQAIDYAGSNKYDIIFMDLHMPGIDGYETSRRIRQIPLNANTAIIALTANAMSKDADESGKAGMNDILIKPVSDKIMHNVINQWVFKTTPTEAKTDKKKNDRDSIFSLEQAKEFTGNNEALAIELFTMLRAELDEYCSSISRAVEANDTETLGKVIHKLHGASRCCGTTELQNLSSEIEALIHNRTEFDLQEKTGLLLAAIQRVREFEL